MRWVLYFTPSASAPYLFSKYLALIVFFLALAEVQKHPCKLESESD